MISLLSYKFIAVSVYSEEIFMRFSKFLSSYLIFLFGFLRKSFSKIILLICKSNELLKNNDFLLLCRSGLHQSRTLLLLSRTGLLLSRTPLHLSRTLLLKSRARLHQSNTLLLLCRTRLHQSNSGLPGSNPDFSRNIHRQTRFKQIIAG